MFFMITANGVCRSSSPRTSYGALLSESASAFPRSARVVYFSNLHYRATSLAQVKPMPQSKVFRVCDVVVVPILASQKYSYPQH
jgi:hypothetical protein